MMKFTREEIDLLKSAIEFLMQNAALFDDKDRIKCENVIDKLIKEAAKLDSDELGWYLRETELQAERLEEGENDRQS